MTLDCKNRVKHLLDILEQYQEPHKFQITTNKTEIEVALIYKRQYEVRQTEERLRKYILLQIPDNDSPNQTLYVAMSNNITAAEFYQDFHILGDIISIKRRPCLEFGIKCYHGKIKYKTVEMAIRAMNFKENKYIPKVGRKITSIIITHRCGIFIPEWEMENHENHCPLPIGGNIKDMRHEDKLEILRSYALNPGYEAQRDGTLQFKFHIGPENSIPLTPRHIEILQYILDKNY